MSFRMTMAPCSTAWLWCFMCYRACSGAEGWKSVCHPAATCVSWHAGASRFIPRFHTTGRLIAIQTEHIATSQWVAVDVRKTAAGVRWNPWPTAVWLWGSWTSEWQY